MTKIISGRSGPDAFTAAAARIAQNVRERHLGRRRGDNLRLHAGWKEVKAACRWIARDVVRNEHGADIPLAHHVRPLLERHVLTLPYQDPWCRRRRLPGTPDHVEGAHLDEEPGGG